MYPTTCNTPMCRHTLFTTQQFHGVVETKCPRCHNLHTYRYGSDEQVSVDVRCNNSFKGHDLGGWCGQLIAKISPGTYGSFGYRCPRCKDRKTIRIQAPVLVST